MIKVSIITVVYNGSETIESAIKSVLSQDYQNIEYIIVDGYSTDDTLKKINIYRDRINVILSEPDLGIYDAINKGIALARGEIITFLHCDDVYTNSSIISNVINFMNSYRLDYIYGDVNYLNKSGSIVRCYKSFKLSLNKIRFGIIPAHTSLFMRRYLFDIIGYYSTDYKIAGDFDFFVRLAICKNIKSLYFPEILVNMQRGGISNLSFKNRMLANYEIISILKNYKIRSYLILVFFRYFFKILELRFLK